MEIQGNVLCIWVVQVVTIGEGCMSGFSMALKRVAAAAAMLFISQAQAASALGSATVLSGFGGGATAAIVGQQVDQIINVTGINSAAAAATTGNTVPSLNVGAGAPRSQPGRHLEFRLADAARGAGA